jgi:hypothetical protein
MPTVLIHCGSCTLRFQAPMTFPDLASFERQAAKITPVTCPLCNRLVSAHRENMTFVDAEPEVS